MPQLNCHAVHSFHTWESLVKMALPTWHFSRKQQQRDNNDNNFVRGRSFSRDGTLRTIRSTVINARVARPAIRSRNFHITPCSVFPIRMFVTVSLDKPASSIADRAAKARRTTDIGLRKDGQTERKKHIAYHRRDTARGANRGAPGRGGTPYRRRGQRPSSSLSFRGSSRWSAVAIAGRPLSRILPCRDGRRRRGRLRDSTGKRRRPWLVGAPRDSIAPIVADSHA